MANWMPSYLPQRRRLEEAYQKVNNAPAYITIPVTIGSTLLASKVWDWASHLDKRDVQRTFFNLPIVRSFVAEQMEPKIAEQVEKTKRLFQDAPTIYHLPEGRTSSDNVIRFAVERCKLLRPDSANPTKTPSSGARYSVDSEQRKVQVDLLQDPTLDLLYQTTLRAETCPDIRMAEIELGTWVRQDFLKGGSETCSTITDGGTHSIRLALKTYAKMYPQRREVLMPRSAHVAFDRVCKELRLTPVYVDLEPDGTVSTEKMRQKINSNTLCMVASAPNFALGTVDPFPALSQIAKEADIPFHLDMCLGSSVMAFAHDEDTRYDYTAPDIPAINLSEQDGITSVSLDLHKYVGTGKGIGGSCLVMANKEIYLASVDACGDSSTGIYGAPNAGGSRAGAVMISWGATLVKGKRTLIEESHDVIRLQRQLRAIIEKRFSGQLKIVGNPDLNLFAIAAADPRVDIYELSDLTKETWRFDQIQAVAKAVHFCVTPTHVAMANEMGWNAFCGRFCEELQSKLAKTRQNHDLRARNAPDAPKLGSEAGTYKAAGKYPVSLVEDMIRHYYLSFQHALTGPEANLKG